MQLKVWLVRKHPSHLGMQLKHLYTLTQVYRFQWSHCHDVKMVKVVMGAKKEELEPGMKTERV